MKKLSPIRSIAWIALSFIAAPFAGVTAAICWVQDKVAGEKQDWQQVFQDVVDARNGRHTPPTDKEQIIKAAVLAIEDVMPSGHDQCPENSVCHLCDILTLEPILEALKGLIDGTG